MLRQVALVAFVLLACIGCVIADYKLVDHSSTASGQFFTLALNKPYTYGGDISRLAVDVTYVTENICRVKIFDLDATRWEVPDVVKISMPKIAPHHRKYKFKPTSSSSGSFGFDIVRNDSHQTPVFSTLSGSGSFAPLIFENQYLEISTTLPQNPYIYGLGERVAQFRLPFATYTLFARDQGTPPMLNLYGQHPFYLEMRDGAAHGVFLLNSNPMDVVLQPGALTYKVIGGVLDFFFIMGPTPDKVISQYHSIIGLPHFPPYWALGFHQCRWGYKTIQETANVVSNYEKYGIPLDAMWNDIDLMDAHKDFTTDPVNFPTAAVSQFIQSLHDAGKHYVAIIDPGIKVEPGYAPFDEGNEDGVWILNSKGKPLLGSVWPGDVYFPDFTNPDTYFWWYRQFETFLKSVPLSGAWIDMNEIANFCDGECPSNGTTAHRSVTGGFDPLNPPYKPENGGKPLDIHGIPLDAIQRASITYNSHSLYGHTESIATKNVMESIRGKRSLVVTRSSFAGTGHHVAHWLGDNTSEWPDLYYSIPGILSMQMFGIPLVGADICGFSGATTKELCTRWLELGAFYPFSRDHNAIDEPSQEPYVFGTDVAEITRKILLVRYSLLPYYYTLFYHVHTKGGMVWNPMFFVFNDQNLLEIDKQFMVGHYLMVTPVLTQGATSVSAYFPANTIWYDFFTGAATRSGSSGTTQVLDAPIDKINVHVRAGGIIPMQVPATTTAATRKNAFKLLVALNQGSDALTPARGELYVDDGDSLTSVANSDFSRVHFEATQGGISTKPTFINHHKFLNPLGEITVYGLQNTTFVHVRVNGVNVPFNWANVDTLVIPNLSLPLQRTNTISWS